MWLIPLALLILFELVADIFSKEWSLHGHILRWAGALSAYLVANIFWLYALKHGSGLARGAIIFSVVSAIVASFLGFLFYKEDVSYLQLAGIAIGIFSLILIFWEGV